MIEVNFAKGTSSVPLDLVLGTVVGGRWAGDEWAPSLRLDVPDIRGNPSTRQEVRVRQLLGVALVIGLAGCNPYLAATSVVHETYGAATDLRSLSTQETDAQAEIQLKAALLASPVKGTSGIDVYCRRGVMVLAGVVPPGSTAGQEAVRLARQTPGVTRVETFFVSARPSWASDFEIKEEIRAQLIADPNLISGRVDVGVYAGHVMLVGVVESPQKAQQFEAIARSVRSVLSVKSFLQTA